MRLFTTILLTMFIGACTGNTNVAEKPTSSQTPQQLGVKASPELEEKVQKAIKERAPQSTTSAEEVVPTIVVTPETEPDVETSVTKVPEKE